MTSRGNTFRTADRSVSARPVIPRGVARAATAAAVGLVTVLTAAGCGGSAAAPAATNPAAPARSTAAAPTSPAPEISPAGDIPDSQVFVAFTAPDGAFSVSVPQGWARTSLGRAALFSDKFNRVRIEQRADPAPVDAAAVRGRELPAVAASVAGYAPGDVRTVARKSGPAVLATYFAASAPNPVTGKSITESVERYSFWRGGREVIVTLSGPTGADNVDPWRRVTDSFRWLR